MSDTSSIIAAARAKSKGEVVPAKVGDFLAVLVNFERDAWCIYPVVAVSPDGIVEAIATKTGGETQPWVASDIGGPNMVIGQHRLGDLEAVRALCWKRFNGLNALRLAVLPFKAP
jgi:hypothetical protein